MQNDGLHTNSGKRLTLQQQAFMKTEEGRRVRTQLKVLASDPAYNTLGTYAAGDAPDTSFVDKHMLYLSEHPKLSTQHYLSNLRLKTKIRR